MYYSKNFSPNEEKYISFAIHLSRRQLSKALMKLSQIYHARIVIKKEDQIWKKQEVAPSTQTVQQFPNCMTIYDQRYGNPKNRHTKGTPFSELSGTYSCSLCETTKSAFEDLEIVKTAEETFLGFDRIVILLEIQPTPLTTEAV